MKLFDEIEIVWGGETKKIKPSFDLLQQIESTPGLSLMNLTIRSFKQDIPLSLACLLYCALLDSIGVKASPEVVYESVGSAELIKTTNSVINACLPDKKGDQKAKDDADEKKL